MRTSWLQWLALVLLAGFFFLSGVSKAWNPGDFAESISRYQLIGEGMAWVVALWLPWMEITNAVALIAPRWRRAGVVNILAMLLVFEAALASAAIRGLDIDCGCLGGGISSSVHFAMARNLVLGAAAVFLLLRKGPRK